MSVVVFVHVGVNDNERPLVAELKILIIMCAEWKRHCWNSMVIITAIVNIKQVYEDMLVIK